MEDLSTYTIGIVSAIHNKRNWPKLPSILYTWLTMEMLMATAKNRNVAQPSRQDFAFRSL